MMIRHYSTPEKALAKAKPGEDYICGLDLVCGDCIRRVYISSGNPGRFDHRNRSGEGIKSLVFTKLGDTWQRALGF